MSRAAIKHLIISGLLLVVALGAVVFMILELLKKEALLTEQLTALEQERLQENSLFQLQKISEDTATQRAALGEYFFRQGSDSIDFLNQVERLAPQIGVQLETNSLQEIEDKKAKQDWIEVQFTSLGSRSAVTTFVAILEQLPYLSQITSLELTEQPDGGWQASVTMRILILPYAS